MQVPCMHAMKNLKLGRNEEQAGGQNVLYNGNSSLAEIIGSKGWQGNCR